MLGKRRCEGVRQHIVQEVISESGLHEGTLFPKIKPSSRDYTTVPESKAIEYMQHELLYFRQEVEFLKNYFTGQRREAEKIIMGTSGSKFEIIYEVSSQKNSVVTITELCDIAGVSRSGYYR